jgi:ribosomal-protein-alanine N-acetyltransferase
MPEIFIETPRLILRQLEKEDHEAFIALNQDKDVMGFFPSVLTAAETMSQIERIANHIEQYGYGRFAVERKDNRQFIGFTGLAHATLKSIDAPFVEIGWRLSKANWGQGFATEAAKACLDYGFNALGLDEIHSFTAVLNKRSEQVMKKIGMVKQGLFDHPAIEDGHILKQHILYKSKFKAI